MKKLFQKLIHKIIILLLILATPIVIYVFTSDDVQITWNINSIKEMNKYTIITKYISKSEGLYVKEQIEYINKTNKNIQKVFLYINNINIRKEAIEEIVSLEGKEFQIKRVRAKGKNLDYRIIGKDKNILMVNLDNELEKEDKIIIEIDYDVNISKLDLITNEGEIKYSLDNWYPIIAYYNKGWHLENTYDNKDKNYFYVEIEVPEGFKVNASGRLIEKIKKKGGNCFIFQNKGTINFWIDIISTKK